MIQLKHIRAAWIEQHIEFDSVQEMNDFIKSLDDKHKLYKIVSKIGPRLRIRLQYNNNSMEIREGDQSDK